MCRPEAGGFCFLPVHIGKCLVCDLNAAVPARRTDGKPTNKTGGGIVGADAFRCRVRNA